LQELRRTLLASPQDASSCNDYGPTEEFHICRQIDRSASYLYVRIYTVSLSV
jgi:hypothetical protein